MTSRPKRARKRDWELLREIDGEIVELRFDWHARLRNALLAMARMDSGWIYWIEKNVPTSLTVRQATRIVERQARILVCRGYSFTKTQWLNIVYSDRMFSKEGLMP